ncbi:hypothetical protein EPN28_04205 [Patescibacteria group bacterium]|nr:MAG: hypothetical protein EPN28_04205 [Patescibacteria group bacterium]
MSLIKKIQPREGELVVRAVYRYQLTNWWKYMLGFALLFAASFFMFRFFSWGLFGYGLFGVCVLVGAMFILRTYIFNRTNCLVITDQRVVDINRVSMFDEVISSVGHHDILDVSARRNGILENIFNYGGISIHTKNSQFALDIVKVRRPIDVQAVILELGDRHLRARAASDSAAVCRGFIKIIPELSQKDLIAIGNLINEQIDKVSPFGERQI